MVWEGEARAVANPTPQRGGPVRVFLRLDTVAGLSGYGEVMMTASVFGRLTVAAMVQDLVQRYLIGHDLNEEVAREHAIR